MNDKLIEDYLNRATRDLSPKQREDVKRELRSHILDSADALAAERRVPVDDAIIREVLGKMGPADRFAAGYPKKGGILFDKVIIGIAGILVILVILMALAGACSFLAFGPLLNNIGSNNVIEHRVDTTSHAGAGNVSIDASTIGGNIQIVESPSDNLEVTYNVKASKGHLGDIVTGTDYHMVGDTLNVETEAKFSDHYSSLWGTRGADLVIKVPRNAQYDLDLKTAGGDVTVPKLSGGSLIVNTAGGNIDVGDVTYHDVTANTAGGKIMAKFDAKKATFDTLGGDITLTASQTAGDIKANTAGGDITLTLPRGTLFSVDASTMGGRIRHSGISLVTTDNSEWNLNGRTEGGAGNMDIDLKTMGGNIDISY